MMVSGVDLVLRAPPQEEPHPLWGGWLSMPLQDMDPLHLLQAYRDSFTLLGLLVVVLGVRQTLGAGQ